MGIQIGNYNATPLAVMSFADAVMKGQRQAKAEDDTFAQQQLENAQKQKQIDSTAAYQQGTLSNQTNDFDFRVKSSKIADLKNQQAPIAQKLATFKPGDPAASELMRAYTDLDMQIKALSAGLGSPAAGGNPFGPSPSASTSTPTPGNPFADPISPEMMAGKPRAATAPVTATGQPGGNPFVTPPENGQPSASATGPAAFNPFAMTPAEQAAAASAATLAAADAKAKEDANAKTEQQTAQDKTTFDQGQADRNSFDAFRAGAAKFANDPVAAAQWEAQWNKSHGTDYNVGGMDYAVNPAVTGTRLPDGVQGPQPQSFTQPFYAPDQPTQTALDAKLAEIKASNAKAAFDNAGARKTGAEVIELPKNSSATRFKDYAEGNAAGANAAAHGVEADAARKNADTKATTAAGAGPSKIEGMTAGQVDNQIKDLQKRNTVLSTPDKKYPVTSAMLKAHPDWNRTGFVSPRSATPQAATEYDNNTEEIERLRGIRQRFDQPQGGMVAPAAVGAPGSDVPPGELRSLRGAPPLPRDTSGQAPDIPTLAQLRAEAARRGLKF